MLIFSKNEVLPQRALKVNTTFMLSRGCVTIDIEISNSVTPSDQIITLTYTVKTALV